MIFSINHSNRKTMTEQRNGSQDTIYHVYNRGNKKDRIFYDYEDYNYFLKALFKYSEELNFVLFCYCLMDNHFHFCCKQKSEKSLTMLMQRLNTSYAMYFNKKYKQVGDIFQGRYKSKIVNSDNYLAYLSMYIHANPIKKGVIALQEYPFSSYSEYYNCQEVHCDHSLILSQFNDSYLEYFVYGQKFKEDRLNSLSSGNNDLEAPPTRYPNPRPTLSDILNQENLIKGEG